MNDMERMDIDKSPGTESQYRKSPLRLDSMCLRPAIEILPRVLGETNQINSEEEALNYFENLGRRPWVQGQKRTFDPILNQDIGVFIWRLISHIIRRDEPGIGEEVMQTMGLLAYFNSSVTSAQMCDYLGILDELLLMLTKYSLISCNENGDLIIVLNGSARLREVVRNACKLQQISDIQTSHLQIRHSFDDLVAGFPDSDLENYYVWHGLKRSMVEDLREFVWSIGLRYSDLVQEYEYTIGRPVCKNILIGLLTIPKDKRNRVNHGKELIRVIEQTMSRFRAIFGPIDPRTVDFTLMHLKALILTTYEPNYRKILGASMHYRSIFQKNFWRHRPSESPSVTKCGIQFVELMLSFANQCKDKMAKSRVLMETYRVCQMFFNFEVDYGSIPVQISNQDLVSITVDLMTCLKELCEISKIPPVLKQFRLKILPRAKRSDLKLSLMLDFIFPLTRSRTSKIPLKLKTAMLEELFLIANNLMRDEFGVLGIIKLDFPKCFSFFIKCAVELKKYDQLLEKCKECNAGLFAALMVNSRISEFEEKSHVDYFELGVTAMEVFECGLKIPDEIMQKLFIQESLSMSTNLIGFSHEYCDKLSLANENIVTNIIKCFVQLGDIKQFEHFIKSYEEAVNLYPTCKSNPHRPPTPAVGNQAFPGLGGIAMLRFAKHILKYLKIPTTVLYLPILKQVLGFSDRYFLKVLLKPSPSDRMFVSSARAIIEDCGNRVNDLYYEKQDCPPEVPKSRLFVSANLQRDDSILNILPPSRLSKLFYELSSV